MVTNYNIRVEGHLDPCWSEWLEEMAITHLENGQTLLSGPLADQAALYGLLNRIRDMNLILVKLERCEERFHDMDGNLPSSACLR